MNRSRLILGSRKMEGKVPLKSRLGNSITRLVYRLSTRSAVYDTQTGLRAYSDKLIDRLIEINGSRYEYEMNMLIASLIINPIKNRPVYRAGEYDFTP